MAFLDMLDATVAKMSFVFKMQIVVAVVVLLALFLVAALALRYPKDTAIHRVAGEGYSFFKFFYANFLKPHSRDHHGSQQGALENFYKTQADIYDTTRKRLLKGREDMLGLCAAQLRYQKSKGDWADKKPIWVDVGGGTGWNLEAMQEYLDVPAFFAQVYLVDFTPSLCKVAQARIQRLGWKNVHVVCQDARLFELEKGEHADLITVSYSLSMMPNFHSIVDGLNALLRPHGIIGVVDFYVQSVVETSGRNYMGGSLQRHVNWLGRSFWRAWFDLDRVGLEGARRDYLEYRFGTLKSVDDRNYILHGWAGAIPYYIFVGKQSSSTTKDEDLARLDAGCTESPYLSPRQHRLEQSSAAEVRSKAYESAIVNLSAKIPLPSTFYQNLHHRIYYDDSLPKHTQFKNDFIYAFTWEDSRVDLRLLKLTSDDVILCLTSAGDNLLDYMLAANPRRVHAVDLNPSQNHLLELKVAAYRALPYVDFWNLFGEGRHSHFRSLLIHKMSPFMSSQAMQFWLSRTSVFTGKHGLYERGGSGQAIRLVRYLIRCFGLTDTLAKLCDSKTLNEQRELWPALRRVLLSRPLHWAFVGSSFLWTAAGVPPNQAALILDDHIHQESLDPSLVGAAGSRGEAIWQYINNTFEPVAQNTLLNEDNFYYRLCLTSRYSRRCHPPYLSAKAHAKFARPGALEGLRIHTDELNEVITRIAPGTLTVAVVMDSMDWMAPASAAASTQIRALNRALRMGGRVLLRSAGLKPWYVPVFESLGFTARRMGARLPGMCIDRVNMYASTWLMHKSSELDSPNHLTTPSASPAPTASTTSPSVRASSVSTDATGVPGPLLEQLEI